MFGCVRVYGWVCGGGDGGRKEREMGRGGVKEDNFNTRML